MKFFLVIGLFCGATLFAGLEGTYVLDQEAMLANIDKSILAHVNTVPEAEKAQARTSAEAMKPMIVNMIKTLKIELNIKSDGTVAYVFTGPDGQPDEGMGSWVRDGDNITFTNDSDKDNPISGTIKNEKIYLQQPNMQFEIILLKK